MFVLEMGAILTAAAKVSGLIGGGKAIHGFYKYFTKVSEVEKSTEDLLKMSSDLDDMLAHPQRFKAEEARFLEYFLTKAAVLFPYVKRKLVNRLIVAVTVIIGAQVATPIITPLTDQDNVVIAGQIVLQVLAGFLVNPNLFLDFEETRFLRNVMALQEMFHSSYVLPPIKTFNALLQYLTDKRFLKTYDLRGNWDQISAKFHEAAEQPERFKEEIFRLAKLPNGLRKKRLASSRPQQLSEGEK